MNEFIQGFAVGDRVIRDNGTIATVTGLGKTKFFYVKDGEPEMEYASLEGGKNWEHYVDPPNVNLDQTYWVSRETGNVIAKVRDNHGDGWYKWNIKVRFTGFEVVE